MRRSIQGIGTHEALRRKKPKFNLICIGSTKDPRNRVVVSEEAQMEHSWSTTTLANTPADIQKKIKHVASEQPRHKRMLNMSAKHFTFECQSQIFGDSICSEQEPTDMPNHQLRFDDGIFFLLSLITTLFNHSSEFDANQLVNIFLPFSKNPDLELGRLCTIHPAKTHIAEMPRLLTFVFAMSKRMNSLMKDTNDTLGHMDVCQGRALFEVISNYNINTTKGRNELFKLIFDEKTGAIGGIYENMKHFDELFPKEAKVFNNSFDQISKLYV